MSAIADIFTGGSDAADEARRAAQDVQFQPFNIFGSSLGSVQHVGDDSVRLGPSQLEQLLGPLLQQGTQGFLGEALAGGPFGSAGANLSRLDQSMGQMQTPDPTATQFQQFGGLGDLLGAGRANLDASGAARQALGDFDPNAFAGTQFERLNALAQTGEATQAQQLLERLHGSGRLGVTEAGQQRELSELATAQEQSRNQRLLQAVGLAGTEQDRLANQAGMFGQLGQGMVSGAGQLQQAGNQLNAGQQRSLFEQLMQRQQFGQQGALTRFGAAQEALGTGLNQRRQNVDSALSILGGLNQVQQGPLALLAQSIGAGMGGLQASNARAGIISNAAQQEAQSRSQFFSGLMGAAGNIIPSFF